MIKSKYILGLIIGIFIITLSGAAKAQYSEYEIKAAYIFNFAKFIDWEKTNSHIDTITLGIYNADPFGIILEKTMLGRTANGKEWKIKRVHTITELKECQIVFLSDIGKYEYLKLIEQLRNSPVLTVGDELEEFCENGGMVNFTPQYSKHQFEINNNEAKANGIIINPKLLLLAKIVSGNEDEF